jgi:hypothetical protein
MNDFFHASFKVAGTKSFRLASAKLLPAKSEDGYGNNAQNVPDQARRAFIPRSPSFTFIQADLEGAEAIAVALLLREGQFRDLVRLRIKPHNFLLCHAFTDKVADLLQGVAVETLTPRALHEHANFKPIMARCKKLPVEYGLSKKTIHGYNYGEGWKTFRDSVLKETQGAVVLTAARAKGLLDLVDRLFPEIKERQRDIEEKVKNHEAISNLFGHRAQFIGRFTGNLARTAISWSPQSTIGQCTNIAACRLQDYIEEHKKKWNILVIVHDSILIECPQEEVSEAATALKQAMTFTFTSPVDGWKATIGVEVQVGLNWGKFDEEDNPKGLKVV